MATIRWKMVAHAGRKELGDTHQYCVTQILINHCAFSISGILAGDELDWHSIRNGTPPELGQGREAVMTKRQRLSCVARQDNFCNKYRGGSNCPCSSFILKANFRAPIVVLGFIGCTESDHADLQSCSAV
jgi:hypothetical protein